MSSDKDNKDLPNGWEQEAVFRREKDDPLDLRESLEAQLDLERQRALRVMADFENHKRRVQKERETLVLYANEKLLKELLPVLDDMERAVLQARDSEDASLDSFMKGVQLIHARIQGVMERAGVKAFVSVGETFDPTRHEAVMQRLDEEAAPSMVLEELEKGYMLYSRLLRPAKAVVNARRAPRPEPVPEPMIEAPDASGRHAPPTEEPAPEPEPTPEPEPEPTPEPEPEPEPEPAIPPAGTEPSTDNLEDDLDNLENELDDLDEIEEEQELTGGAFEIDEEALGSLEEWEKEFKG